MTPGPKGVIYLRFIASPSPDLEEGYQLEHRGLLLRAENYPRVTPACIFCSVSILKSLTHVRRVFLHLKYMWLPVPTNGASRRKKQIRLGQARADRSSPLILHLRRTTDTKEQRQERKILFLDPPKKRTRAYCRATTDSRGPLRTRYGLFRRPKPLCLSCQLAIVARFSPELKSARGRSIGFVWLSLWALCILWGERERGEEEGPVCRYLQTKHKARQERLYRVARTQEKGRQEGESVETGKRTRYKLNIVEHAVQEIEGQKWKARVLLVGQWIESSLYCVVEDKRSPGR
ncbi:hypothetical protein PspLS_04380 [Pyricularia sp. CBS 133598]|nr:hypothetical protein PspLS_04380 [Pyricularia sp. CBS 133598]